jgi:hypothetical protein
MPKKPARKSKPSSHATAAALAMLREKYATHFDVTTSHGMTDDGKQAERQST